MELATVALKEFTYYHCLHLAYALQHFAAITVEDLVMFDMSLRRDLEVTEACHKRLRKWLVTRDHCRSHDQLSPMTEDVTARIADCVTVWAQT